MTLYLTVFTLLLAHEGINSAFAAPRSRSFPLGVTIDVTFPRDELTSERRSAWETYQLSPQPPASPLIKRLRRSLSEVNQMPPIPDNIPQPPIPDNIPQPPMPIPSGRRRRAVPEMNQMPPIPDNIPQPPMPIPTGRRRRAVPEMNQMPPIPDNIPQPPIPLPEGRKRRSLPFTKTDILSSNELFKVLFLGSP